MSAAMGKQIEMHGDSSLGERLSAPELHKLVERFVRRRVPELEVDDLVQTVLVHALASKTPPEGDEDLRKWLVGITRHKVADFHRRGGRANLVELPEQLEGDAVAPNAAHTARELADWAEEQTQGDADAQRTLNWMARESVGEKLAHIAEQEALPPAQVRQRVSRMRRFMKQQWAAELAAVAAVLIIVIVAWRWLREPAPVANPQPDVVPMPDVGPAPSNSALPNIMRARKLRVEAERACELEEWRDCLDKLNEAAGLDPEGAKDEDVSDLRRRAEEARRTPEAVPSASSSMRGPKDAVPESSNSKPTTTRPAPAKREPRRSSKKKGRRRPTLKSSGVSEPAMNDFGRGAPDEVGKGTRK